MAKLERHGGAFDLSTTGADSSTLRGLLLNGRYRITELLGEGAMGRVYAGVQVSLARKVAIKVIQHDVSNDPQLRRRFFEEAKTLAGFSHPNIVGLLDFGESDDGMLYCVLEYVEGVPLAELVAGRQMSLGFVLVVGAQIASALSEAHSRNVIHRDLKPDNVFVTRVAHGALRFKLLDFGISRAIQTRDLTVEEGIYGTPTYLSPEQAKARPPVVQSDFYGLGVVLYELLTGQPLFEFRTIVQVVLSHANKAPPDVRELRPDVPVDVARFLLCLLDKDPAKRPRDAMALLEALEALMDAHGIRQRLRADAVDVSAFVVDSATPHDEPLNEPTGLFEASEDIGDLFAPRKSVEEQGPPTIPVQGEPAFADVSSEVEFDTATVFSNDIPSDEVDNVMFGLMGSEAGTESEFESTSFDFDNAPGLDFSSVDLDSSAGPATIELDLPTPPPLLAKSDTKDEQGTFDGEPAREPAPFVRPSQGLSVATKVAVIVAIVGVLIGGGMYWLGSSPEPVAPEASVEVEPDEPEFVPVELEPSYVLPSPEDTKSAVFGLLSKTAQSGWRFRGEGINRSSAEETSSFVLGRGADKVLASFTFAAPEVLDKLPKARAPEVSYRYPTFVVFLGPVTGDKVPFDVRKALQP